jgi:hypothetical protein
LEKLEILGEDDCSSDHDADSPIARKAAKKKL